MEHRDQDGALLVTARSVSVRTSRATGSAAAGRRLSRRK